ncbi:MAG: hypothetical protein IIC53_10570, partial [Proteobacteria bacterium]|nr:hypothetical protein [Pseudomonadota bacterium]
MNVANEQKEQVMRLSRLTLTVVALTGAVVLVRAYAGVVVPDAPVPDPSGIDENQIVSLLGVSSVRGTETATRLVTGPRDQLRRIVNDGGVATGATIRFKWLPAQVGLYPPGTSGVGTADFTFPGARLSGQRPWLGVFISGWGVQGTLFNWQAALDSST